MPQYNENIWDERSKTLIYKWLTRRRRRDLNCCSTFTHLVLYEIVCLILSNASSTDYNKGIWCRFSCKMQCKNILIIKIDVLQ